MMEKLSVVVLLLFSLTLNAQKKKDADKSAFHFQASYLADVVSNFSGGLKTGTNYLGLVNLKLGFDTENAKLWRGGTAYLNAANTHGGKPSETLVGDFLGVSNIEAGNLTFLYELWYRQSLGQLAFTVGLQDLNADFASNKSGLLFTNSSFGIQSSIADNIPTPIFPLTALGFLLKWNISDEFVWQSALYDGDPEDFETNPLNLQWKMNEDDGFLAVTEFQMNKSLVPGRDGTYKAGVYYHEHNDTSNIDQKNGGVYVLLDQQFTEKLSVFSQIGFSPKERNKHNNYYSLGLNYRGLFKNRPNDQAGFAIAYAGIDGSNVGSETAFELTYLWQICEGISIRPDLQYIVNPAGTSTRLKNALVGFIRFGFEI